MKKILFSFSVIFIMLNGRATAAVACIPNPSSNVVNAESSSNSVNWAMLSNNVTWRGISMCASGLSTTPKTVIPENQRSKLVVGGLMCFCKIIYPARSQWVHANTFGSASACVTNCSGACTAVGELGLATPYRTAIGEYYNYYKQ